MINITKLFHKIPAATMIVPMFITAIITTIFPKLVEIGGLTTAVFSKSATAPLTGVVLFLVGTQIKMKAAPKALLRGSVLLIAKFAAGFIPGILIINTFGINGVFGVSALAIFVALLSSNGAIYLALVSDYGEEVDAGAYSLLCLKDSPLLPLIAIGASGAASVPFVGLLSTIIPMLLGALLGNLFDGVSRYFKSGVHIMIPLVGIAIGASLNLVTLVKSGMTGILLGIFVLIIGALILISADKLILRRPGYAGAALATTAGSAVAYPAIIAQVVPSMKSVAASASVQVAASVIVTAILGPLLTGWVARKWGSTKVTNEVISEGENVSVS